MKISINNLSKKQATDSGMAFTLIFLLLGLFVKKVLFFKIAILILIVNMIFPSAYKPFAFVWLKLSHFLGSIVSKIILTVIFFLVVTPMGLLRRLMGHDTLMLNQYKKGNKSVFTNRDIMVSKKDIEKTY